MSARVRSVTEAFDDRAFLRLLRAPAMVRRIYQDHVDGPPHAIGTAQMWCEIRRRYDREFTRPGSGLVMAVLAFWRACTDH